ncbi:MAG TPA: AAA family ATPase [Opitutaceae bacterium]|nr:AAA family ATPase [Opitutaceae bacterium]
MPVIDYTKKGAAVFPGESHDEETPSNQSPWPLPVRASDLCSKPAPAVTPLIDGLLAVGGTSILSAPSKGRKTFTTFDIAVSVATGGKWLGMACRQGVVIYLNFELSESTAHRRLEAICRARGIEAPANLLIWNLRGRVVNAESLREHVLKQAKDTPPALIILDPLYKISANSGAEENSNDGQARILNQLEDIAREAGSALLIVHHFAKGASSEKNAIDRASGAGALARAPDSVLTLTEHEENDMVVLEASLRDFAPLQPLCLRWSFPVWSVDGSADPAKLKKRGGVPEKYPAAELQKRLRDGMTNQDWLKASTWTEPTYRSKRDQLLRDKKVSLRSGCYYAETQEPQKP